MDYISHFFRSKLFPCADTVELQPWRAEDFRGADSQPPSPFRHNPEGAGRSLGH